MQRQRHPWSTQVEGTSSFRGRQSFNSRTCLERESRHATKDFSSFLIEFRPFHYVLDCFLSFITVRHQDTMDRQETALLAESLGWAKNLSSPRFVCFFPHLYPKSPLVADSAINPDSILDNWLFCSRQIASRRNKAPCSSWRFVHQFQKRRAVRRKRGVPIKPLHPSDRLYR
jgi:hypothetical protein